MDMEVKELVKALKNLQVQTGSLVCLGCGHEHGCGMHGCAILRDSANLLESMQEELDRVKAERDAAVEDLKKAIFDDCTNSCTFCAHQNPKLEAPYCLAYFCENDEWQWRGLEGRTSHE
jgi:hypothetical protein